MSGTRTRRAAPPSRRSEPAGRSPAEIAIRTGQLLLLVIVVGGIGMALAGVVILIVGLLVVG